MREGLGALLLCVALLAGCASQTKPQAVAACAAGEAALKYAIRYPGTREAVVFDRLDARHLDHEMDARDWFLATAKGARTADGKSAWFKNLPFGLRWPIKAPGLALAEAYARAEARPLLSCPEVRAFAVAEGVRIVRPLPSRRTATDLDVKFAIAATRPVVSPDGREAVLYLANETGSLSGGGDVLLLRRSWSGGWRVVAVMPVWMS